MKCWWPLLVTVMTCACPTTEPTRSDAGWPDAGGTEAADASLARPDAGLTLLDGGPPDSGLSAPDAGPAGVTECPTRLPRTGDHDGAAITREGFGCFGGCGPSCKAECLESAVTVNFASSSGECVRCTYRVTACKSHEFCRWHDDCYRQCDLRWAAVHAEAPASPPSNPCYLTCDNVVVHASALCGADWSQLATNDPVVHDSCWDGSMTVFTQLVQAERDRATCANDDRTPRPWAPNFGAWASSETAPATLPLGYSCTNDTDCPDRNQRCDPHAGDYPGVNGWGRCVAAAAPAVDVTPLEATGTQLAHGAAPDGNPCWFGYDCASGHCRQLQCAP